MYESSSDESAGEGDEQDSKDGLLDLEDLGPMMKSLKKAKVKIGTGQTQSIPGWMLILETTRTFKEHFSIQVWADIGKFARYRL